MDKDEIRDVAIHVVEQLLDKDPDLLHEYVHEVNGKYTEYTWGLQDAINDALTEYLDNGKTGN